MQYSLGNGGERCTPTMLDFGRASAMNWNVFTLIALIDVAIIVLLERRRRLDVEAAERLRLEGVRATAVVATFDPIGRMATRRRATLAYRDLDGFMQHFDINWPSAEISKRGIRVGSSIPIHYLAGKPTTAAADETPRRVPTRAMIAIIGGCVLALGAFAAVMA